MLLAKCLLILFIFCGSKINSFIFYCSESRRKTPLVVSMKDDERLFSDPAMGVVSYLRKRTNHLWIRPSKHRNHKVTA